MLIEQMMDELEKLPTEAYGTYVKADALAELIERYRELDRQQREDELW